MNPLVLGGAALALLALINRKAAASSNGATLPSAPRSDSPKLLAASTRDSAPNLRLDPVELQGEVEIGPVTVIKTPSKSRRPPKAKSGKAVQKPSSAPAPATPKPAAALASKPAAPAAPKRPMLPRSDVVIDIRADKPKPAAAAVPAPPARRSAVAAARALLDYVGPLIKAGKGGQLGTKGKPNATVLAAQGDMGGVTADGIYGPASRARGRELLGVLFPARG